MVHWQNSTLQQYYSSPVPSSNLLIKSLSWAALLHNIIITIVKNEQKQLTLHKKISKKKSNPSRNGSMHESTG